MPRLPLSRRVACTTCGAAIGVPCVTVKTRRAWLGATLTRVLLENP